MTHKEFVIKTTEAQVGLLKLEVERGEEIIRRLTVLNAQRYIDKKEQTEWDELEKLARHLKS